jgi:hypothetical protein
VLLLPLPCATIYAVLAPSEEKSKRGLVHEFIFAWRWEERLVAAMREKRDREHRRLEAAGRLELGYRYVLRAEAEDLVLITIWPAAGGAAKTQEDRRAWGTITQVERVDRLLLIHAADGTMTGVARSAFADGSEEEAFVRLVEARRAAGRERVLAVRAGR